MKIRNTYKLMSMAVAAAFAACTADDATEPVVNVNPDGTVTQKIEFFISGGANPSDILTRDVPPGVDTGLEDQDENAVCSVNKIRILTFRRAEGSDASFLYDADNSTSSKDDDVTATLNQKFPAEESAETTITGSTASHTITKEKGFEYRVIAIGYNTERKVNYPHSDKFASDTYNEADLFKIVDQVELNGDNEDSPVPDTHLLKDGVSRFEDVSLQLVPKSFGKEAPYISAKEAKVGYMLSSQSQRKNLTGWYMITPEIYYGTCRTSDTKSEIIKFSDSNELTGYLYRGVAKLTVNVSNIDELASTRHVCSVALLADSVRHAVKLADYDNFKTPYFLLNAEDKDENIMKKYFVNDFGLKYDGNGAPHSFTAIAIDGHISKPDDESCHRYSKNDNVKFETFLFPTQTRLYFRYTKANNLALHGNPEVTGDALLVVENSSDGMQATGVIDPIAAGEFIYFRRNKRYSINVDGKIIEQYQDNLLVP